MHVHLLGVRGSTSAPGPAFARYGGHTSCVAVGHDGEVPSLVLDAGTGLRRIGELLHGAPFRGTVLLTHLHWDHTHGLPFARPLDHAGADVHLLLPVPSDPPSGSGPTGERIARDVLAGVMGPPHFPITPDGLRGRWSFGTIEPSTFAVDGFTVTAAEVPHKGGRTYGYRVSDGTSTLAYLPDHGPSMLGPGPDGLGERHSAARALAHGVDVLLHDAQHTAAELPAVAGFGHSAAEYAVDLGRVAGARSVVLFHHDPDRTDDQLDAIGRTWTDEVAPTVVVAHEDLVLVLPETFCPE
ncbi:MAG: MBL fold metallo-hydrolase [Acidimicrobiales bacterium]